MNKNIYLTAQYKDNNKTTLSKGNKRTPSPKSVGSGGPLEGWPGREVPMFHNS